MAYRFVSGLLAATMAVTSAPAFGQSAPAQPEAATTIESVVVTGRRDPPVELMPEIDSCMQAAMDPYVAALQAVDGGGPRIYVKTRPPRNPDYSRPPLTPPGSAMPEVMSIVDWVRSYRTSPKTLKEAFAASAAARAEAVAEARATGRPPESIFSRPGPARMRVIAQCLLTGGIDSMDARMDSPLASTGSWSALGPSKMVRPFSAEMRDKTLPLGFALFEEGRYEEALEQFKLASAKYSPPSSVFDDNPSQGGNLEPPLMIGKIYLYALREKSDPVEAVSWLKKAADARFNPHRSTPVFDPREPNRNTAMGEAAMILAEVYREGWGSVPKDPVQSRRYLQRAYEVGHIPAAKLLGDIYYQGIDTPPDLKLAFKHYMEAATFAHVPAVTAVAQMYETGEAPGGADPAQALAWRNQAAKADDPKSLYALAVAYDRGEGVKADAERALPLYKLSAMNGEPAAMTALGTYFYRGEGGLPQDLPTARGWFEQAALMADADGMVNLAAMMARGEGGDLDRARAWGWLKIAERQGHPTAGAAARAIEALFNEADKAAVEQLKSAASAPPYASESDPEAMIASEFIGSAPGGPAWWKVSKGEASVWIFGLAPSPTPESLRWNTGPLRSMLNDARLVIAPYSPSRRARSDPSPFPVLPQDLGAQVTAAAIAIRVPLRHREATLSDALTTHWTYSRRNHLDEVAPGDFYRIAARRGIYAPPQRPGPGLASIFPAGADVRICVEAIVADIDAGPEPSRAAAQAWAAGDVAGALRGPRGISWACRLAWPDAWAENVGFQVEAIALALEMPGKVVVASDIGQLVAETGILPQLRERGYEVSGPMQPPGQ